MLQRFMNTAQMMKGDDVIPENAKHRFFFQDETLFFLDVAHFVTFLRVADL